LFEDAFVCMVRQNHPVVGSKLSLAQYLGLRHVVVAPSGTTGSFVDTELERRGHLCKGTLKGVLMHGSVSARARSGCLLSPLLALLALGCGAPSDALSTVNGGASGSAGGSPSAANVGGASGAGGAQYRAPSPLCRAPAGVSNNPQSIAETITLLNALPKPLTIPCFLESLARPLPLLATFGVLSAQPAVGTRSPRMFLFFGPNRMSIVPDGVGASLLEFGEERPDYRSLKAEVEFPLTENVPPGLPFERVMFNETLTTCGLCHAAEESEPNIATTRAFVSQSLRPAPRNAVPLQSLRAELAICNPVIEPYRCGMLDSLFSLGPVTDGQFPSQMPTFE
jgi:hypothetical protein